MRLILSVLAVCFPLIAQRYSLGPDSQRQPGVPKGDVTAYTLAPGKFYPGTPHHYSLYVPKQYQAGTPAPLIIFLDGSGFLKDTDPAPTVLDNLIAKHDVPPTLAIFIDPGVLPTLSENAQNRYERIFEYDSLSDRFANFLIDELIPEVGKRYRISDDPNARAVVGVSTGAVGALMAAWNRPDQFRRVVSFIGTYVAMKGADTLPALIRKTEPKPLRIFMQDGRNDHIAPNQPFGTFYAGSWPINNEVMFQALQYAGYDVKFELGEGAHDMVQGAAILPDALRWLWRGYPAPIEVRPPAAYNGPGWDPRGKVLSVISYDQPWRPLGGPYRSVTSLTRDRDGNVFFLDESSGQVFRANAESQSVERVHGSKDAKAIAVGGDGRLYVSESSRRRIMSYVPGGGPGKVFAQNLAADEMVVRGTQIYFLDAANKRIGVVESNGKTKMVGETTEMGTPASLALSPDQEMLVIPDSKARFSWSFQIGDTLRDGEPFFRLEMPESGLPRGATAAAHDVTGQVYFATPMGIQICEPNGRMAAILNAPRSGGVADIAFGGKDWSWLYVADGDKLYRRPVNIAGTAPFTPNKAPKPAL